MDPLNDKSGLKVAFWNVNGLPEEKFKEDFFLKQIQLLDIIFLPETWHREDSADKMLHPHGYLYENVYRKNKKRKGRATGGILVYYKKELKNILTFLEKSSENILWAKIAKVCLHADREVYLAGIYNSPKHSNYTKENNCNVTDILREQLSKFSSSDIIFIGGDFNSRVRSQDDFIIESENDLDYLPQDYEIDSITSLRNNQDISMNGYGQYLLDLCTGARLRILNGRTRRDLQGHITYIGNKGTAH